MSTVHYDDMTEEQMLAWGREELALRLRDLSVRTHAGLTEAKANADARRKAIGASLGQAADMVILANRAARREATAS